MSWPMVIFLFAVSSGLPGVFIYIYKYARISIRIHAKQRVPIRPTSMETRAEQLSPEMREFAGKSIEEFRREGFEVESNLYIADPATSIKSIQIFLVNRRTNDCGVIVLSRAGGIRSFILSTGSRFPDGKRVGTTSKRVAESVPPDPMVDTVDFSWVRDARVLYEAHRRRLEVLGLSAAARVGPAPDKVIEWLDDLRDRQRRHGVEVGYLYMDETGQAYRYTWKGAILLTLKAIPLVQRLRTRHRDRQARQVWNHLNMDDFCPELPAPPPRIPDTSPRSEAHLQYTANLPPGEIRRDKIDGAVVVRIGGQTVKQAFIRRSVDVFVIGLAAMALVGMYRQYLLFWKVLPGFWWLSLWYFWPLAALWLVWTVQSAWRLTREISACKGTILVTANSAGLNFRNAPGIPDGLIPREEIRGLAAAIPRWGFGTQYGRLNVRLFDKRTQKVIIPTTHRQTLLAIRKELAEAMGMEIPIPPPLPGSNVAP
jgi:hypothetical protein